MSIKVVDLQTEGVKEEQPAIEEAKEEAEQPGLTNEIIEAATEEQKEETKEEVKEEVKEEQVGDFLNSNKVGVEPNPKPKPIRAQDRIITCPKCDKSMKMKSYRYTHEQNCKGNLSERPVKKHTNPRPKQQPKPKPKPTPQQVYYSDDEEDEQPTKPFIKNKQPPKPINHISALAQHYQLLQNEFIKQKQERYNNLCMKMFSSKTKKR